MTIQKLILSVPWHLNPLLGGAVGNVCAGRAWQKKGLGKDVDGGEGSTREKMRMASYRARQRSASGG